MHYEGARKLAALWVEIATDGGGTILDDMTMDRPYGWVFFYQSARFLETRNPLDQFAGNAPLIINRFTRELRCTGTAHPTEHYLAEYEATLPSAQMQAKPERPTR
jgi:immunity protein 35 of polymorphic toxin system